MFEHLFGYADGMTDPEARHAPVSGSPRNLTASRAPQQLPARLVANRDLPTAVPVRPQGNVPVIVRIVWSDGAEEWRPARAVRWTATHVMVAWRDDEANPRSERHEWLKAGDVARSVSWLVPPGRPS